MALLGTPDVMLSTNAFAFSESGGTGAFQISANVAWQAQSMVSWIHLTGARAGIGDGTISFTADGANFARVGSIAIFAGTKWIRVFVLCGQVSTVPSVDVDGDGMDDNWEGWLGLDPTNPDDALEDFDGDGQTNLEEFLAETNPFSTDSDNDGLPDPWENANGLDPVDDYGANGEAGDPDGDGLTNLEEMLLRLDPHNPATHGIPDADFSANGGQLFPPDDYVEVPFSVGDPSGSHSERWQMSIQPLDDRPPRNYSVVAGSYGTICSQPIRLKRGIRYLVSIRHLGSRLEQPDYDWEATIGSLPYSSVLAQGQTHAEANRYFSIPQYGIVVDNKDGLLGTCDDSFDDYDNTKGKLAEFYIAKASITAFQAGRGIDIPIPNDEKATPGCLVLPRMASGPHPLGPHTVLGLNEQFSGFGLSRTLSFSSYGKLSLKKGNTTVVPSAEMSLSPYGSIIQSLDWETAMHDAENATVWPDSLMHVDVTYNVKDRDGVVLSSDTVRLLRPVVIAIGDSLTYGYMSGTNDYKRTPRWDPPWNSYPSVSNWSLLNSPWNDPSNRTIVSFQGYRGYLALSLPGLLWLGEETNDHGPRHCGYPGAETTQIASRLAETSLFAMPRGALSTDKCYAFIVFFLGTNDINNGHTTFSNWEETANAVLNLREGKGRTMFIVPALPYQVLRDGRKIKGTLATQERMDSLNLAITTWNSNMLSFSTMVNYTVICPIAGSANVAHDSDSLGPDDGLHFYSTGYGTIATLIYNAMKNAIR